jgi:hypothetical protein
VTTAPLCVLLLPCALDEFARADEARDLLRAPAVVAVEPARVSRSGELVSAIQARRVIRKLHGAPRVVVLYDALQYPLARALVSRGEESELWYGGAEGEDEGAVLHELAAQRAALRFVVSREGAAFQRNAALWERLEELGIARR